MSLRYSDVRSPVGELRLVADDEALVAILWESDVVGRRRLVGVSAANQHPVLRVVEAELAEYFAGTRTSFGVPLRPSGTEFQHRVWKQLQRIRYGECCSYGDVARAIGQPTAARAVGAAIGRNPICIIVPCHRVVGQSGKLTGFAGGLEIKAQLLALERRVAGADLAQHSRSTQRAVLSSR